MPLNVATLTEEVRKITDPDFSGFEGFPTTDEEVAERWSEAMAVYFGEIFAPPFTPVHIAVGKAAMVASMEGASVPGAGPAIVPIAIANFAAAMAVAPPPTGLIVVPPASPAPFAPPPPVPPQPAVTIAAGLALSLDAWAKTGLQGPPPTTPPAGFWS